MPEPTVTDPNNSSVQAGDNSTAVGSLNVGGSVEGSLIIGSHNVVGFTSDQVSTLITQISTTFQVKPFDGRCPYKGLETFNEEDAELFFGREKWIDNLLGRIKESRALFVTGQSGSGKSSLVRAGVIPCLKTDYGSGWLYATMKPGRDPINALANAFSRLKDPGLGKYLRENAGQASVLHECAESTLSENANQRLVLYIDQFEEVFTQLSKDKAQTFINLLDHAATIENGRVIVLFSMRSDFVPNCATYPQLNAILNQQFVQIGAMQPEELVSAIAQPALRVGLKIDPDLIAQIINDMKGEPGALPLMQFALKDLFDAEQAKGGMIALTLSDYLEHGGINQALERHANASLEKLTDEEKELARNVFSGLIEIGRGTQDTRRTALSNELIPSGAQADAVKMVVQKLASARLITTDATTVTISHEKLIDAWPWLKKLVNENRDVIAMQNEIAADAKEWEEHKRDPSYLYSGARLATTREKMKDQKLVLSGLAQEFIEQSIALQDAERKAKETLRRRIIIGLVSGIVIAMSLAVFGFYQSGRARENAKVAAQQKQIAQSGELAAEAVALRNNRYQLSLLLGVEAYKEPTSNQSFQTLLENVQSHPQLKTYLSEHKDAVTSVAFSPDGKTLASGSRDNTIILWDVATGTQIRHLEGHTDYVTSLAFNTDGKTLASGSRDMMIILWDVATGNQIGQPLKEHTDYVFSLAFSLDGKTLASGGKDQAVILWDLTADPIIGHPLKYSSYVTSVAFSPDSTTLASGSSDTTIILWDVATGTRIKQFTGHTADITSVAFGPDGKTLASGSRDNTIILWDVATGTHLRQLTGHTDYVTSIAFSPDGKTLASASWDRTIILWDVATGTPIGEPLKGHVDSLFSYVTSVAFSPNGKTLASGSSDATVILWDVAANSPLGRQLNEHIDGISNLTFSPDSKTFAAASNSGTITLWNVAEGKSSGRSTIENASNLTFSPDGKTIAYGNKDGTITFWDFGTGKPIGQPLDGDAATLTFSPDGKKAAFGTRDGSVKLWDITEGTPIGQPLYGSATAISFSSDGKTLAVLNGGLTIELLDATTGNVEKSLAGHTQVINVIAFSPDGKTLASGSDDATIILWDVSKGIRKGEPLEGHTQPITSLTFSPDGKTLASGSCRKQDSSDSCTKGEILLWDLANQQPIGLPFMGHTKTVTKLAFSPDSKTLASGSEDSTIILWDLDPQSWIERSCQRANRNFTLTEWEQYFPAQKEIYQITCNQFPPKPQTTSANIIATPIPEAISSSPVKRPATDTVQLGESLDCIARRYNVNPKEMFALNSLLDDWIYGELIIPGQLLKIPQTGNPFPGDRALRSHPAIYTVLSANETLSSIACQFGDLDPLTIAMANELSINVTLAPGQSLNIP